MRPFSIIAICTFLLALPCFGQEGTGSLTGSIRYEIPGQTINATLQSETLKTRLFRTHADSSGGFQFSRLPADDYTLTLEALGFERTTVSSIHVSEGEHRSLPTMELIGGVAPREANPVRVPVNVRALPSSDTQRGILAGRVIGTIYTRDRDVRSATGAEVRLICANGKVCAKTNTDSNGAFQFTVTSSGTFQIRVKAKGFYPVSWSGYKIYTGLESTYQPLYLDPLPKGFFARWFRTRPIHMIQ